MIGSLFNGINGMLIHQTALNVESNNIANVNSVGFKSNEISFADMVKGQSYSVTKNYTTGNLVSTTNPLDMAINGRGFFVLNENGRDYYTRAGNFKMGADGNLVTQENANVMGIASVVQASSNTGDDIFDSTYSEFVATQYVSTDGSMITINTKASDYNASASNDSDALSGLGMKTSDAKLNDISLLMSDYQQKLQAYASNPVDGTASVAEVNSITFDMTQVLTEDDTVGLYVNGDLVSQEFDTALSTTFKKLSDKISALSGQISTFDDTTGKLTMSSLIPGSTTTFAGAYAGTVSYDVANETSSVLGTGLGAVTASYNALQNAMDKADAKILSITNTIDLAQENTVLQDGEAFELSSIQLRLDTLGNSTVPFGDISVENGVIFVTQGSNKYAMGKIPTVTFADTEGLEAVGGTKFKAFTAMSGMPIMSTSMDQIMSQTLELSNADLGSSLTKLMVYQRAFEANSKSLTTSDEFLNIAIQLKS